MSSFNEDLVSKYLIENISPDLTKEYSLKTVLMLDYCYKKNENIPKNITLGIISKITSKQVNNSSKTLNLEESSLDDILFLESFKSLLSDKTKSLVKDAKTAKDFKALIIVDEWSGKIKNPELYLSSGSLDSKVTSITKAYEESRFEKESYKEYLDIKECYLKVSSDLRKPLTKDLIERFSKVKEELDEKSKIYSKQNLGLAVEIQTLIRDTSKAIDNKLNDFISNANQRYNRIRKTFEDNIWDSERKVNQLIGLRSELKDIRDKYQLVLCKEGVNLCNSLDRKISDSIYNHNYVRDKKEEFQEVKREVSDYYNEIDSIFCKRADSSSVGRLNRIYNRLKSLSSQEFHECIPSAWQEDYYKNIDDALIYTRYKYKKRINFLTDKSSRLRQKIDGSWFSWNTKKFADRLDNYNNELKAWSKCQII